MIDLQIGFLIIILLRFLVPLTIFRWPLPGAIATLGLDAFDLQIASLFGGHIPNYILTDKYLDMYYLTIELFVSLSWANKLARNTSVILFIWRFLGVVVFQFTGEEKWLVFTPNIFELFFIFFLVLQLWGKETRKIFWFTSRQRLSRVLLVLFLIKIPQEVVLHVWKKPATIVYTWWSSIF